MTKELRISLKIVMEYQTFRGEFRAPLEHIKWLEMLKCDELVRVMSLTAMTSPVSKLVQFLDFRKKSVDFVISEFSKNFENSMRIEILKNFKINILRPTMS